MIVLHTHKLVFVKTRKTAGTSVEIALSTLAGAADIVTPISPDEDEQLRREAGGTAPQNYTLPPTDIRPHHNKQLAKRRRPKRFYNHMPASSIREHLGQDLWRSYFTFAIERNPWDKAVSRYAFNRSRAQSPMPSFSNWLRGLPKHRLTCFDLYSENDEILVDRVILYERLEDEFSEVCRSIGATVPSLPQAKGGRRKSGETRHTMFTDADVEFIRDVCYREIQTFGYTFD